MTEPYRLEDLGDRRVLTVGGRKYSTAYSARVVRMLVERKGAARTPPYFSYKETRGHLFLDPLFAYLRGLGAHDLSVLEVGCSFGHITEYLAECALVREVTTFDTDPAFAAIVRGTTKTRGPSVSSAGEMISSFAPGSIHGARTARVGKGKESGPLAVLPSARWPRPRKPEWATRPPQKFVTATKRSAEAPAAVRDPGAHSSLAHWLLSSQACAGLRRHPSLGW